MPVPDARLINEDLAPVPPAGRTWGLWHIAALWVSMSVCIPTYMLAASMVESGMDWRQSLVAIVLGNAIVLVPMIVNAHAGTRYGIPFPVYARASFGIAGAHVPALLRSVVACGWFGIQTWIGGLALDVLLGIVWSGWSDLGGGQFLAFGIFWLVNMAFAWHGTESIKWLETLSAPFLIVMGLALLVWAASEVGGIGAILAASDALDRPSESMSTSRFLLTLFIPWLTAMVGYWATLALSIPDFTRYARSQKDQAIGQALGLLTTMPLFAFIGVAVTSATILLYGEAIWNPIDLVARLAQGSGAWIGALAMFVVLVATLSTNIAANVVAPANGFANLSPGRITFGIGSLMAGVIGIVILPWELLDSYQTWLLSYSGLLGAAGGVILCDYAVVRRGILDVADLYRFDGRYAYTSGVNLAAIAALATGVGVALAGLLDPRLRFLFDGAWFSATTVSFVAYYLLMRRGPGLDGTVGDVAPSLIDRAASYGSRTAIVDGAGDHSYDDLLAGSARIATWVRGVASAADPGEGRVAFLASPDASYVAALWGIWRAGGVAVPLSPAHPAPELAFLLDDARPAAVLSDGRFAARLAPLAGARAIPFATIDAALGTDSAPPEAAAGDPLPVDPRRTALILYTSGTTSRPKGVVLTHANLAAQVESLIDAWEWTAGDRILHVLPLHHTHGIVNALLCPLRVGGTCEMFPGFDAGRVWARFVEGGITIFMAVPTIYVRLIGAWDAASSEERIRMSESIRAMRVMVSGSAALPVRVFERWREISGHDLLERYGMTELGMALSNPLHGERRPGTVGRPLPGVEVRLVGEDGREATDGAPGELRVRGETVFREYWNRPEATRDAFDDGWFRTGDQATLEDGVYRILGRTSVDILKTGGYKVSALEIEEALREHPAIAECAVVGVPDPEWGERVCAAIVPARAGPPSIEELRGWAGERLASYKLPRRLIVVDALPRNAMGKVTKAALRSLFKE